MTTYLINGNSMHLAGSQIDISDDFFGSESPESDATYLQRQDAIKFWLSEGWMEVGDVVVWDGVQYIVGGEQMKLIGIVFTMLDGISSLTYVYRCADGTTIKIPAAIGRKQ